MLRKIRIGKIVLLMSLCMLFACAKETVDIDSVITSALLSHYDEMFGKTDAEYKTTGYKIYEINDTENNEKKVFVLANYMEYNLEDGTPVNTAGSGPAGIALTISSDGKSARVDYEVLTDHDLTSDEYKNTFPESVQARLNPMSESDRDEVIKKQEEMLESLLSNK